MYCWFSDDVVLALTTTGTVKVWTLNGSETKFSDPLFEDESKQIKCLNAITLTCCSQNQRTVLIVCSKYWQVYTWPVYFKPLKQISNVSFYLDLVVSAWTIIAFLHICARLKLLCSPTLPESFSPSQIYLKFLWNKFSLNYLSICVLLFCNFRNAILTYTGA